MDEPNGLDRKSLQIQLENYRLILVVNTDWNAESIFSKEDLAEKVEVAQSHMNESDRWGEAGDQTKSYDALHKAKIVIVEIGAVIKHLLYRDLSLADRNVEPGQISA